MTCPQEPTATALYGPRFAADPDAVYTALRERGPAHRVEIAPGIEVVLVTDYGAALEVLRSPYFSRDARRWTALAEGRVAPDHPVAPVMGWRPSLPFADGGHHVRLRTCVEDALARINTHRLRNYVRRSATLLIEAFEPLGRADLVAHYADRLPTHVFTQLLGCPGQIAGRMSLACGHMVDAEQPTAQRAGQEIEQCLRELVASKRRTAGADLTSWLLHHPAALTDDEAVHQLVVLVLTGTVPQASWISSAVMLLLTDERFGHDLTGGSLTVTDALNEVLWTRSPMANLSPHYAVTDHVLRDRDGREFTVPPGVPVLVSYAAANTDPALARGLGGGHRANHAHLAFGAGLHRCPAQDVAVVIAEVAVETLLDRLPDMELAVAREELAWRPGPFHRSLTALPVRFPVASPNGDRGVGFEYRAGHTGGANP